MKRVLLCLTGAMLALANPAGAAPPGPSAPGALAKVEGRITQYEIPGAKLPRDPAADSDGRLYFAKARTDRISRFDPSSGQFKEWALPSDTQPHGITIGQDGHVFFAGFEEGTIGALDPETGSLRKYPTSDKNNRPYSTALDADGNTWATMRAGRIAKLDRASGKITEYPMDGSPYGLAFDRRGILWVTCIESGLLRYFDPKTGKAGELSFGLGARPRRLAVAMDGTVWVSLYGAGKIAAVDSSRRMVVGEYPLPGGPNAGPYSVNVDARGRVWVAEYQTDSVVILEPPSKQFRVIRLPDTRSGVRNATIDGKGRYWYIATTTGKIGVID